MAEMLAKPGYSPVSLTVSDYSTLDSSKRSKTRIRDICLTKNLMLSTAWSLLGRIWTLNLQRRIRLHYLDLTSRNLHFPSRPTGSRTVFGKRLQPKDRRKTKEKVEQGEKEALENAERARLERMMGEEGEDTDEEGERRQ